MPYSSVAVDPASIVYYLFSSFFGVILLVLLVIILRSIRQVDQYERGVKFMFGRYTRTLNPGWHVVLPIIQSMRKIDMRVKAVDVPDQEAITKDNVSARINAVIYYKIDNAERAMIEVENFYVAVSQLAQTTMRNLVGEVTLDELLTQREMLSSRIKQIVDQKSAEWGVDVQSVELKDINLPESMKRTMAKQAEAEREKRATIINSEGEVLAAENLTRAAQLMASSPGALHLRTLNSINDISSDESNTIVFALPMELLRAIDGFKNYMENAVDKQK
ncbi:slipin family protein [Candidatus Gracilibacteria bacterium]|nr:slipin family protein [Candidatus Gracilibacteria bacterium]